MCCNVHSINAHSQIFSASIQFHFVITNLGVSGHLPKFSNFALKKFFELVAFVPRVIFINNNK
jgi:hypothetical protein